MAENNPDEWELSKENVRPLKQGRSFVQLQAALNPSANTLRQQREVFETEIRTYDGDDPLAVWVNYITWTEQNFPKGGREGIDLLQNCINHFKSCPEYFNDVRYIRVWIKFADYQTNADEFYQFMYNNKIGIQLAAFYEAWALFLERSHSTVMADAVFNKGIEVGAQPLERLLKLHGEFQARVARDAISKARIASEEDEEQGVEPHRSALGALRAQGKSGQAPVMRTGSHKPERLLQTTAAVKQTSGPSSVAVYRDENVSSCRLPSQNKELLQVPFPEIVSRENQQKASKWTHVRVKQTGVSGDGTRHTQQLPFVLHEDTDVKQPLNMPHKIADGTGILSTRVESGSNNAVGNFLSGGTGSNEVPMYCKSKIYAGVREMSFEELRAAAWVKRKQEQEQFQSQIQQEVQRQLQLALKSVNLKPEVMQVTCQEVPPGAKQPQGRSCVEAGRTEEQGAVHLEGQPADEDDDFDMPDAGNCENDEQLSGQIEKDARTHVSLVKKKSICDGPYSGQIVAQSEPMEDADVHMETPDMKMTRGTVTSAEPQNVSHLSRPSPTVNTKHALEVVRNMLYSDDGHRQSDFDFEKQFQLDPCVSAPVDVYVDPDAARANKEKKSSKQTTDAVEIYVDPSPPSRAAAVRGSQAQGSKAQTFTIYTDPEISSGKQQQQGSNIYRNSSETAGANGKRLPSGGSGMIYEDPVAAGESGRGSLPSARLDAGKKQSANKVGHRAMRPLTDLFGTGDEVDENQNRCPDDDFNDEINDVEMMMVPSSVDDLLDPNIDFTFCPEMSSTKNLTNVVHFAMVSGHLNQHMDKDTRMAASKLENVSIQSAGNPEPNLQTKTRKSLFMNVLDPIQEGSEDARSRASSMDSHCHSSSSRPSSTTAGSSCASRSSGYQQSSHSSAEFANLQLTMPSSASRNVHKVPRMSPPPGNRSVHFPEGVPRTFEDGPDGTKLVAGGAFGTAGTANDFMEDSMCVDRGDHGDDCGEDVCDSSILIDHVNPYNSTRIQTFLRNLSPALSSYAGYCSMDGCVPRFAVRGKVKLGDTIYWVKNKLGEGGYAKVYLLLGNADEGVEGDAVVAKVQSPACPWEFYIANELQRRLSLRHSHIDISKSMMTIEKAFFFKDGNCFLNENHRHGTLLDFVNSYKAKKPFLPEWMVLLFSIELFHIVEQMHSCDIIHGDLKPDNVLLCRPRRLRPDESAIHLIRGSTSCLKLIDFGQSIDLTMFPPKTTFLTKSSSTPALHCPEIISYRPWNFQVDMFGLVATIYVLLTGNYMSTSQKGGRWTATPSFPRAYKSRKLWKQVFQDFLNIADCNSLPNLVDYRTLLEKYFLEEFSLEEYNQLVAELEA